MTKKHFKLIATVIANLDKNNFDKEYLIDMLGTIFREINPRFDYTRWVDACNGRP